MRGLLTAVFLIIAGHVFAQAIADSASVMQLPEAAISTNRRIDFGTKVLAVDSAILAGYKAENAATLLAQQFPVFVRSYGVNGLATLALRGASAAQTAVRWNGIPMQSGSTGLVDLFSIPVISAQDFSIRYGSNGGSIGSGAVGGVLFISTALPDFKPLEQAALSIGAGSYGKEFATLRIIKSSSKWAASFTGFADKATNDFLYKNDVGSISRLSNAAVSMLSGSASIAYRGGNNDRIYFDFWADKTYREIPPALFESSSAKQQKDAALRSALSWNHILGAWRYGAQLSFFDETFHYRDSAILLSSNAHSAQLYFSPWLRWTSPHGLAINIDLPFQRNYLVDALRDAVTRYAIVAIIKKYWKKTSTELNGRVEKVNDRTFVLGGINAHYRIAPAITARASIGNTYRTPTLNELYYDPGGNRALKPERGWSAETGYDWKPSFQNSRVTFTHRGTAFYRDIHDWIIWFGGAIWTPHNIAEVASGGIETENKFTYRRPKIIYQLSGNATLISSRTIESSLPGDGSIGHQIPYSPRIIAQGNAGFNTRQWRFNYNQTFTGDRYYNSDESGLLPAFATGNILAGWLYTHKNCDVDLAVTIQNVWNARYAEVSGRPAPGINFLLSGTFMLDRRY